MEGLMVPSCFCLSEWGQKQCCTCESSPAETPCSLISRATGVAFYLLGVLLLLCLQGFSEWGPMKPEGLSPDMPCATFFILDPHPGARGQGPLPEPELGAPPRDCPGLLCSDPSAGQSGHLVSAQKGREGKLSFHPKQQGLGPARPECGECVSAHLPGFPCHPMGKLFNLLVPGGLPLHKWGAGEGH